MNDVSPEFLAALPDCVDQASEAYVLEPRGRYRGLSRYIAKPRNVDQVSDIVKTCAKFKVGLVPYSGGTGLVGGQTQISGAQTLLLSLERMNTVRSIDVAGNVLTVDAGVILADVQAAADSVDRLFPLSLASEGSCLIGGNLATNAGGVQVLRYGNARDLCLGVEAVMPDGSIYHGLKPLRKDNTGYDLRHLLIGSEGTLGIITAACLMLFSKPKVMHTAFLSVASPLAALDILARLQEVSGGLVSAFELIHRQGFDFLKETMPEIRLPFGQTHDWMVLCEIGAGSDGLEPLFMDTLETGMADELVLDAVLAQSETQRDEFWTVRESIPEANRRIGGISSHDISIPIPRIPEFIDVMPAKLHAICDMRINCFGHLGDGNLHYNVYPPAGQDRGEFVELRDQIKTTLHDMVHAFGGSVSAEHGIGRLKVDDLVKYSDPVKLAAMRAIKDALDPKGIMNPGALFEK